MSNYKYAVKLQPTGIPALDAAMKKELDTRRYVEDLSSRLAKQLYNTEKELNSLEDELARYESVLQDIKLEIRDTDWKATMPEDWDEDADWVDGDEDPDWYDD